MFCNKSFVNSTASPLVSTLMLVLHALEILLVLEKSKLQPFDHCICCLNDFETLLLI